MDFQKEREKFEAWYLRHHHLNEMPCDYVAEDNSYSRGYVNTMWIGWQAKADVVPATISDIQSWIAVNSFSALDASIVDFPVVDANELAEYIDSLDLSVSVPEGFVLMPKEPSEAIKRALSYQCFDFISVANVYRNLGFDIPQKAENEQSFFLHKFLLLAITHGNDFVTVFNAETKAMIEAQEQSND